jgi:flagellar biosynthesis protein FlhG
MQPSTAIAITSGKGGVGKTNLSVNLALALGKIGKRVALFDADLALANAHILMGVNPNKTVVDALNANLQLVDICTEGPNGVKLISGGSGLTEMMNLSAQNRRKIIRSFSDLSRDVDCLIVDTAAGIEDNVLDFVHACNRVIVVVVGEPAAFIDAYACIKVLSQNGRVTHFDIVVNRARNDAHGRDVFKRFKSIVDRFLTANTYHVATIPEDDALNASVSRCNPVVLSAPGSRAAKAIEGLAASITGPKATPINKDDEAFFAREPMP